MPLKLEPAVDADAQRIVDLEQLAYADDHLTPLLFPGPPDSTFGARAQEMIEQRNADPTARWMKVVDTDTNELVSFAKWKIYEPGKPRLPRQKRTFGPGCNIPVCEEFWGAMDRKADELFGKTPHCLLDLLQTDPKAQGRGAGSILISWGTDVADELGIQAYLEASPVAIKLYTRHGFEVIDDLVFDIEPWGGKGTHTITYMSRPVPKKS